MQKPRLVACDVDGTLLGLGAVASPRTVEVIDKVVRDEVPFVLVTGRPPRWIPPVVREIGHAGLAVCVNGAVLYDAANDTVLSASTLDPLQLRDAAEALEKALPGCLFAVERPGGSAAPEDQEFLAEPDYSYSWGHSSPSPDTQQAPRDELLGRPAIKLLIRHPEMTSDVMAQAATAAFGAAYSVTFSTNDGLIELAGPGLDKGSGLAAVAQRLGVPAADVIAFGDMPNDVPMLNWAGHAVAMANAHPAVLEAADEVTAPNSEDGVALVLERWWS